MKGASDWVILVVGLALASSLAGCREAFAPELPARHVVLNTVDTLRADHVGAYGGPVPTPAMDSIAREGVLVEGACTPTPSTGPAHASIMTGLYPWHHGVLLNAVPIENEDLTLLAEGLHERGFATAAFVSSFNVQQRWGFGRGFDRFHFEPTEARGGESRRFWSRGGETTDAALEWLANRREEDFFLWIHYFDPHWPYRPPPGFERPADEPIDLEGKSLPKPGQLRRLGALIRAYRGEVAYTDLQVGRVLAALRKQALLADSLVVLTADHGEGLGDHGLLGHGRNLHDELVTVPLAFRGPGLPAGERLHGNAQLEDLMPTIFGLLDLPMPPDRDGIDLSAWLNGEIRESPRKMVLGRRAAFPDLEVLFFGRNWPAKWIGRLEGPGETYRLDSDPDELDGVELGSIPETFRKALVGAHSVARERRLDAESEAALRALGYL